MKCSFTTAAVIIGIVAIASNLVGRVRYADKNGGAGRYPSVQAAIDAAIEGDTVRILPGIYDENVVIGKSVVVQGGGFQNTIIRSTQGDAVTITSGKIMWVSVTAAGSGVVVKGATIANCVIRDCSGIGILINGRDAIVVNCIVTNNRREGVVTSGDATAIVNNTIVFSNDMWGIYGNYPGVMSIRYCAAFGNRSNMGGDNGNAYSMTSCLTSDVGVSTDGSLRLSGVSSAKDAGDPTLLDLDGSRSDMGYYGGPDAPLLPYITLPQNITLSVDGSIQFDFTGKVGY